MANTAPGKVMFTDAGLAQAYVQLKTKAARDAGFKCDDKQILALLAFVADRWDLSISDAAAKLVSKGETRDAQVAMIQQGMTAGERSDLLKIFWDPQLRMSAGMRKLMGDVLNIPVQIIASKGPLKDAWLALNEQGKVYLAGVNPDAAGEVNNLSKPNYIETGSVYATGSGWEDGRRFGAVLKGVRPGDWLEVRTTPLDTKIAGGGHSSWLELQVGLGKDTHNADARLGMLKLEVKNPGSTNEPAILSLASKSQASRISEPNATLMFVNERTQKETKVQLDGKGRLPAGLTLAGKSSDRFSVRISDGVNDTKFAQQIGEMSVSKPGDPVNIPDPIGMKAFLNKDDTPRCRTVRLPGVVFDVGGPKMADVYQGSDGDCWLVSTAAGMAHIAKDRLQKMIHDNGDGSYTITLHKYDDAAGKYKALKYTVDADFAYRGSKPLFGAGGLAKDGRTVLWWPLLEKAFAEFTESYGGIDGDQMMFAMETLTGLAPERHYYGPGQGEAAWKKITELVDRHALICSDTMFGDTSTMKEKGYVSGHAYTVVGYDTDPPAKPGEPEKRWVILRNPWGYFEGKEDPKDKVEDGVFRIPLDSFLKYYGDVQWVDFDAAAKAAATPSADA